MTLVAVLGLLTPIVLALLAAFPERRPRPTTEPDPSRGLLAPDAYAREG